VLLRTLKIREQYILHLIQKIKHYVKYIKIEVPFKNLLSSVNITIKIPVFYRFDSDFQQISRVK